MLLNYTERKKKLNTCLKIVFLQMFKIDWILIIKFDTSKISFTKLIHRTCVVSWAESVNVSVSTQGS